MKTTKCLFDRIFLGCGKREVWVCKLFGGLGLWRLIVDSFWDSEGKGVVVYKSIPTLTVRRNKLVGSAVECREFAADSEYTGNRIDLFCVFAGFLVAFSTLAAYRTRKLSNPKALSQGLAKAEGIYGEFLNRTLEDPEIRAEAREMLAQSFLEVAIMEQFALEDGGFPFSKVQGWIDEERAYLNDQMYAFLPDDALVVWSGYAEDLFTHEFESKARGALTQVQLTPENLDYAVQVFAEEALSTQTKAIDSGALYSRATLAQENLQLFNTIRERLQGMLPDEEFNSLDAWLMARISQLEAENVRMSRVAVN